ncbi:MAG: FAD-dependent monooxygenase [Xanthobacteraceae bacterium]
MTVSRGAILVAGAGIGGLTAALALAAGGFRVIVAEKTERLEEVGAGLQLSPNAGRVLVGLGLKPALEAAAVAPDAVSVMSGPRGTELVRLPLDGADAAIPYWVIHRADLQGILADAVAANPDIELCLGCRFEGVSDRADGVTVNLRHGDAVRQKNVAALIGADGVWSDVRRQIDPALQPAFSGLIAWRGTVASEVLPLQSGPPRVQLWMGENAHLVTYPISRGRQTNVVAISSGQWRDQGWSVPATATEASAAFTAPRWSEPARAIMAAVEHWRKWALCALPAPASWTKGATALLGDAVHAMLPFAAQGAGMAIEDAAVLAQCLAERRDDIPQALRRYESLRRSRVARVQSLARRNGQIYHLAGPLAAARDLTMRLLGGRRLLARQNWIYDWRA